MYRPTLEDFEQVLAAVPESSGAHMDVAGAAIERGQWDKALAHLDAAAKLRYPCPGLLLNHRAVIAARTGDYETMMAAFTQASRIDPQHFVLIRNINQARAWFKADGPKQKLPLELEARHDFQLLERTLQPTLPGPLPADLGPWLELPESARSATFARRPSSGTESASEFEEAEIPVKTPELEGSKAELRPKGKLHVLS
jgi:tetratricopeptide (TPR) repeat protein